MWKSTKLIKCIFCQLSCKRTYISCFINIDFIKQIQTRIDFCVHAVSLRSPVLLLFSILRILTKTKNINNNY